MVLKQGEGYKPRGKTSVIVGTSKMQFHLPLEAEPGQAWAGKQEAAPMSMWTLLHGALPRGSPSSPQGAKELALSCKSSSGKHLQVPSQWRHCPLGWLCTSLLPQQQPTWVNPVSNLTWGKATPALPCPALSLWLDWGCFQERWPFSRCRSCPASDRLEQMVMCSTSSSCRRNIFIIRHGVFGVSVSAALCSGLLTEVSLEGCDLPPSYLFTFVSQEKWRFARFESA